MCCQTCLFLIKRIMRSLTKYFLDKARCVACVRNIVLTSLGVSLPYFFLTRLAGSRGNIPRNSNDILTFSWAVMHSTLSARYGPESPFRAITYWPNFLPLLTGQSGPKLASHQLHHSSKVKLNSMPRVLALCLCLVKLVLISSIFTPKIVQLVVYTT